MPRRVFKSIFKVSGKPDHFTVHKIFPVARKSNFFLIRGVSFFGSNSTKMKRWITCAALFVSVFAALGQKATPEFLNLFGPLPAFMSDAEIRNIPKTAERISAQYLTALSNVSFGHTYFPVGKVVSGKTVHVIFADFRPGITSDPRDFLITLTAHSYNQKSGEMVVGGSVSYLAMCGRDQLFRESSFKVSGEEITFTIISTDEKGQKETESATYRFSKSLEFVK